MNHIKHCIAASLAITGLCLSLGGMAQDMTTAVPMQQPAMPMMGMQQGTMPMMQGQRGGMPMMPGYQRHGMPMMGQRQPGNQMHGCQHGGKHPMAGDGKGMRHKRHEMMQAHHKNMEERLARIETLLQQLVDQQKQ